MSEEDIRNLFGCCHGSPVIVCQCGRTNYVDDDVTMDEGEFEKLDAERIKNPEKYVFHSNVCSVTGAPFNGDEYVFGCDCKWEDKLEKFLIDHQKEFVSFYKNKAKKDKEVADKLSADVSTL